MWDSSIIVLQALYSLIQVASALPFFFPIGVKTSIESPDCLFLRTETPGGGVRLGKRSVSKDELERREPDI